MRKGRLPGHPAEEQVEDVTGAAGRDAGSRKGESADLGLASLAAAERRPREHSVHFADSVHLSEKLHQSDTVHSSDGRFSKGRSSRKQLSRADRSADGADTWGERVAAEILRSRSEPKSRPARSAGAASPSDMLLRNLALGGPRSIQPPASDGTASKRPAAAREPRDSAGKDAASRERALVEHTAREHTLSFLSAEEQADERSFDPGSVELQTSWSTYASTILCLNVYPNGITVSQHSPQLPSAAGGSEVPAAVDAGAADDNASRRAPRTKFAPGDFHLRFRDTRDYQMPAGRYFLHREGYLQALEAHLSRLHQQGHLADTVVYFGMVTDPFLSLHKKFDVTMGCLGLFERYQPRHLVVQTRSPMVISGLPTLKYLREKAVVVIPVETFLEKAVVRYMPGKPRLAERIVAADGLRRQGVRVNILCGPVLPYGDFSRDAWDFAEILDRHSDYVTFGSLASGSPDDERMLKVMPIAQKLAADKQYLWLRPHSYRKVYEALRAIRPDKLLVPVGRVAPNQLNLFAA